VDDAAPIYLHDTLEEQSASGYRTCGQAEAAVTILERKIAATPDLHRDQGHQLAKLANTVLATHQPDPERAVELGLRCVATARSTGSARITKELRNLDRTLMRRWPTWQAPPNSTRPSPPRRPGRSPAGCSAWLKPSVRSS
jgi:hypothetical protein